MRAFIDSVILTAIVGAVIWLGIYADVLKRTALGYVRNR